MTVTPSEIHDAISEGLGNRAVLLRRQAASRKWGGLRYAHYRASLRAEAERCETLQQILVIVDPVRLAALFEAPPYPGATR